MVSKIRGDDDFDSEGIVSGTAKAWANFDGTTNPVVVRNAMNVLGVTDEGSGSYRVHTSIPIPSEDCTFLAGNMYTLTDANIADQIAFSYPSTDSFAVYTGLYSTSTTFRDSKSISVAVLF